MQHLVGSRYGGIQPSGTFTFPPQIDAVSELVGPSAPRGGRQIDALLIAAGVNNLDFSDILKRCVLNNNFSSDNEDCVREGGLADKIEDLRREYAYLALGLFAKSPSTSEVYLNDYPRICSTTGPVGFSPASSSPGHRPVRGSGDGLPGPVAREADQACDRRLPPRPAPLELRGTVGHPLRHTSTATPHRGSRRWSSRCRGRATWREPPIPTRPGTPRTGSCSRRAMVLDQGSTPYRRVTLTLDAVKAAPGGFVPLRVDPRHWRDQKRPDR